MDTMYILGGYIFGIQTAAPQEFSRDTTYNWPAQDIFGMGQSLQFTGWGDDSITLNGVIYTEFIGSTGQLDAMRREADKGQALTLIDGRGNILGDWAITKIAERQDAFARAGTPLRQHFSLSLRRYGRDAIAQMVSMQMGKVATNLTTRQQTGLAGLLGSVASGVQAGGVAASALEAAGSVLAAVTTARDAYAAVNTGIQAAKDLRDTAKSVQSAVRAIKDAKDIDSVMNSVSGLLTTVDTASIAATRSGGILLKSVDTVPENIKGVVKAAGYASNQLATATAKIGASMQRSAGELTQ